MEGYANVGDKGQLDTRGVRKRVRRKGGIDYTLLVIIFVLTAFGIVMVYSSSYFTAGLSSFTHNDPMYYAKRQSLFALGGMVAMFLVSRFDYHVWFNKSWLMYIAICVMMVLVLATGKDVNGAKRWLYIGSISFQPSEIAKAVIILCFARLIYVNYRSLTNFKRLVLICVYVGFIIDLAGIENLSSAVIMAMIIGVMVLFAIPKFRHVIYLALIAGGGLVVIFLSKSYRSDRISSWLDDTADATTGAVTQSAAAINAIGSGGLFGSGIGQSLQKMGTLSEAHNDMIFSIVCEEFGFFGGVGVILLFVVMMWRMYKIVFNAYDLYGALIVVGVMTHIGFQALVNVAVVTGVFPNTGVPLPFISYGGTSLLFLFGEVGLVMSVAKSIMKE